MVRLKRDTKKSSSGMEELFLFLRHEGRFAAPISESFRRTKDVSRHPSVKVLIKLFQKFAQVEAAEASSPSAEGETPLNGVSFLITFFFAPLASKKKVAMDFALAKCL